MSVNVIINLIYFIIIMVYKLLCIIYSINNLRVSMRAKLDAYNLESKKIKLLFFLNWLLYFLYL